MTSAKQCEANRANATKSTGPKTEEGKATSAMNAFKHGLSGDDVDAPGLINLAGAELEALRTVFRNDFQPKTIEQERLVETLAVESVKIDRARATYFATMTEQAERAAAFWDKDRIRATEHIFAVLNQDPARWSDELEATSQGCLALLKRWSLLKGCLIKNQSWTENQRSMAYDLLGTPTDCRDAYSSIDPENDDVTTSRLELCDSEIQRLKEAASANAAIEVKQREHHENGDFYPLSNDAVRIDRYEQAADRRYERARKRLIQQGCIPPSLRPRQSRPQPLPQAQPEPQPLKSPEPQPSAKHTIATSPKIQHQEPAPKTPPSRITVVEVEPPVPISKAEDPFEASVAAKPPIKHAKRHHKLNRRDRRALAAIERHDKPK